MIIFFNDQVSKRFFMTVNPFYATDLFLYPPENIRKPEVF